MGSTATSVPLVALWQRVKASRPAVGWRQPVVLELGGEQISYVRTAVLVWGCRCLQELVLEGIALLIVGDVLVLADPFTVRELL